MHPAFENLAEAFEGAEKNLAAAETVAREKLHFPDLKFPALRKHLRQFAQIAREGLILKILREHQNFSVMPHAIWLGQRRSKKKTEAARRNGRLGGRSRSAAKRAAARENGGKNQPKLRRAAKPVVTISKDQVSLKF